MRLVIYTAVICFVLAAPALADAPCSQTCDAKFKVKTVKTWRSGVLPKEGVLDLTIRVGRRALESEQVGDCHLRFYGQGFAVDVKGCSRLRVRAANSTDKTKTVRVQFTVGSE